MRGRFFAPGLVVDSFDRFESVTHSSVLRAGVVFDRADTSDLFDQDGNRYIDFCSGGYGHNVAEVRSALIFHLSTKRLMQSCDCASVTQRHFVEAFTGKILQPRNLRYRILFTEPGPATAVHAALKLACAHKNRTRIIAFTGSSHSLGSGQFAPASRSALQQTSPLLRNNTTFMPYCGYFGEELSTIAYFRHYLEDTASGLDRPAAVILETVQVHGGVHIASNRWLEALGALCAEFGILLIVDDSSTGCGAAGPYFSFENVRLNPDIVVVSSAIGGGLPISMLLLRPELYVSQLDDQVAAFQGNGLAFAAAEALLGACDISPSKQATASSKVLSEELGKIAARYRQGRLRVRGKGLIWGLDFGRPGAASVVAAWALERGVIVEPARARDDVLLIRPAVTIDETTLREGLDRLDEAVSDFLSHQ